MKAPAPRSLLVEHPALPQPFEAGEAEPAALAWRDLDDQQRRIAAVQLVAVTSLLAEFELWPRRWCLRRARVESTDGGLRVRLRALPVPLSPVWSRLGGGDPAAEAARSAVLAAIAARTGLDPGALEHTGAEPGFFLDGVLARLLEGLERPLEPATARSLWMWRWAVPPAPEPGDTSLHGVADRAVARRLGAAMWAAAVRDGRPASLVDVEPGRRPRLVAGPDDGPGLRILTGDLTGSDLTSLLRPGGGGDRAVAALGRFPTGWNPEPVPAYDPTRLAAHLGIAGLTPARRVRLIDGLDGRIDPFSSSDRAVLDRILGSHDRAPRKPGPSRFTALTAVAALAPGGLPRALFLELAGCGEQVLDGACAERVVVCRGGRVMLPQPAPLQPDPRHEAVAGLFASGDPRRRLHRALATGNPGPLLDWARARLDELDAVAVRRVLGTVANGALGPGVQLALAEACLGLADIHGARRALDGVDEELARPWWAWLRLVDRPPEREIELPLETDLRLAPRAAAEIALVRLRRALQRRSVPVDPPLEQARTAADHLEGAARRWIEIRIAALTKPARLDDADWRRRMTAGHPELIGLVMFERSLEANGDGGLRAARRLLRRVMAAESAPGRLALMQTNLGVIEGDLGNHREAQVLTLGAFRLFQTAGFRYRCWDALHNLAVEDIDHLRLRRAATRLDAMAELADGLWVAAERARLALAAGDLDALDRALGALPGVAEVGDVELVQALSLLAGARELFAGSVATAAALLEDGGPEGEAWLSLADALNGRASPPPPADRDPWGVGRAAELVTAARRNGTAVRAIVDPDRDPAPRDAMALALAHHFGVPLQRRLRRRAAAVLEEGGVRSWAARLRWDGAEVEAVFEQLCDLAARPHDDGEWDESRTGRLLGALGVDGLAVRRLRDGRELWRTGSGEERTGIAQGGLELVPLGTDPAPGALWNLVAGVLELSHGTGPDPAAVMTRDGQEVRIDGPSPAAQRLRDEVRRVAGPRFAVLILGETGSGKEVVASEIHRLSGRSGGMVSVNIAAVPVNLLEAELFGTTRGAFTGADRARRGLVAAADGGTLFLDEVGDLDVSLQVKLLRFLESGEIRAVGSDHSRSLDVRVLCATHRNLERRVREGRFRQDLYYRIAVGVVRVPPLRERVGDIPVLRSIFEAEAARRHGLPAVRWTPAAERLLLRHRWPGNVRELKHTVEVAMARAAGGTVGPEDLRLTTGAPEYHGTWEAALSGFKRGLLRDVLTRHRGNRSAAARELGISRQALLYQLNKLALTDL